MEGGNIRVVLCQIKMFDGSRTLQDVILRNKEIKDKGVTIIYGENKEVFMSYNEIYEKSLCLLGDLQGKGIKEGDLLIFQLEDNIRFIISFWASILGRIIPVPLMAGNKEKTMDKLLKVFDITEKPYILMEEKTLKGFNSYFKDDENNELKDRIIEIKDVNDYETPGEIKECDVDDIAFIQFSSGSTGLPKGVMLSHRNLIANTEGILEGVKCIDNDSSMSWMPLTHDMGLIGFHLSPFRKQINQYLIPTQIFILRPMLWIKKASEHKVTVLSSPNFGYKYFLKAYYKHPDQEYNLGNVRVIFNGAEPISIDIINEFLGAMEKYGLKKNSMFPVYGLAEASLAVAFPPVEEEVQSINVDRFNLGVGQKVVLSDGDNVVKCVDEGYVLKYCEVKICDRNGNELEDNTVGYIKIKGENVTKGFYKNLEETKEVIDEEGWLNTKDLGFKHDGRLVVVGRAKDIIFVNGINYYSYDIEEILIELDEIELGKVAAAGFNNPDTQREEICIFVVYRKSLRDFVNIVNKVCAAARSKLNITINHVIPIKSMPKTTSGKIQRFKLLDSYINHEFDNELKEIDEYIKKSLNAKQDCGEVTETQEKLLDIYSKIFNNDNITVDTNLVDLGADSMTIIKAQSEINEVLGVHINVAEIYSYSTIRMIADYIDTKESYLEPSLILEKSIGDLSGNKERIVYKYTFEKDSAEAIKELLENKNYDLNELMLSVYCYALFKEFKSDNLIIYSTLKEVEKVIAVKVENKEVDTFDDFVELVKGSLKSPAKEIDLKSNTKLKKEREANRLWVSYSDVSFDTKYSERIGEIEYGIEVMENSHDEIVIKNEFNTEWINKDTAKNIFKTIVNLVIYLSEEN